MTAVLLQVVPANPRDGLSVAADVSIVIVAVAVVVLAVVVALLLVRANRLLAQVTQQIGPVAERSRGIAENVEHITRTVRDDVEKVNTSVTALTDRLKLASDRMEERIEDFNALMEVVQEEAEGVFVDTASTVRGVRAGARALTEPPPDAEVVPEQPERLAIKNG
jgi:signal transduction histidine kinase